MVPNQSRMNRRILACQSEVASSDFAVPDEPRRDQLRSVSRYRKAKSLRWQDDSRVHPDDLPGGVYEGTSGITGIQCRVRLNDIVHQTARLGPY